MKNKIRSLNINEKEYLIYKIFEFWYLGKISKDFLPDKFGIVNSEEIIKIYFYLSNKNDNRLAENMFKNFKKYDFYKKIEFMSILFDEIHFFSNEVPTIINKKITFGKLSEKLNNYRKM